jgi:hypothetical protein
MTPELELHCSLVRVVRRRRSTSDGTETEQESLSVRCMATAHQTDDTVQVDSFAALCQRAGGVSAAQHVGSTPMARDHYIPAAVLGRFSADSGSLVRERRLVVGRAGKVFLAKAEDFGFVNRLYDVTSTGVWVSSGAEDPGSVDKMISGHETELPAALDLLDSGARIPLRPWLRVLVPFVAAMFVRGKDFGARFERRPVVKASGASGPDNTNRRACLSCSASWRQ